MNNVDSATGWLRIAFYQWKNGILQKIRLTSAPNTRTATAEWSLNPFTIESAFDSIENENEKSKQHRRFGGPGQPSSVIIIMNRINDITTIFYEILFSIELEPHSAEQNVKIQMITYLGTMGSTVSRRTCCVLRPPPKWSVPTYWLHNQ